MIKKLLSVGLIASSILATGCATTDDLFISTVNGAYVIELNGSLLNTIKNTNLTPEETVKLSIAEDKTEQLLEDVKNYTDNHSTLLTDIPIYKSKYLAYKKIYEENVYQVALNHKNDFTVDELKALEDTHKILAQISEELEGYLDSLNYQASANTLGKYARTIAQIYFLKGA